MPPLQGTQCLLQRWNQGKQDRQLLGGRFQDDDCEWQNSRVLRIRQVLVYGDERGKACCGKCEELAVLISDQPSETTVETECDGGDLGWYALVKQQAHQ